MRTRKNRFQYCLLMFCTVLAAVGMISCADQENRRGSAISNGVDIAVMPTTTLLSEQETTTEARNFKAIVVDINSENKTLVLQAAGTRTRVQYEYTGGTDIVSKYDEPVTVERLSLGEVVEVWTAGSSTRLTKLKISDADFDYGGVTNFRLDQEHKTIVVGNEKYTYTDNTVVVSQDAELGVDKLEAVDVLRLRGTEKELDSITVTKGHGYLRLDATTFFEGGYLEVGDKIVEVITENMVLAVPTGRLSVKVSKDKSAGSKEVVVAENEEIRLNLTEFQSDAVRLGTLSFTISPKGAKLTVDGVEKDYSQLVDVAYGTHKIIVTADGYEPYAQVITVDSITSEYNIMLSRESDEGGDGSTQEMTGSTAGGETTTKNESVRLATTATRETRETRGIRETRETTTIPTIDYNSIVSALLE